MIIPSFISATTSNFCAYFRPADIFARLRLPADLLPFQPEQPLQLLNKTQLSTSRLLHDISTHSAYTPPSSHTAFHTAFATNTKAP